MNKKTIDQKGQSGKKKGPSTPTFTLDASRLDLSLIMPSGALSRPWIFLAIGTDGQILSTEIKMKSIEDSHNE